MNRKKKNKINESVKKTGTKPAKKYHRPNAQINKKKNKKAGRQRPKSKNTMPRYYLNRDWQFIQELRDLILKSSPTEKGEILARLNRIGRIKLAIITGVFLNKENQENIPTDLFIVADDLDRRKLNNFLRYLEAEVGGEIRFVIMEKEEFRYRFSMFDRFVRVILEGPHEKLINRLGV